jgi:hypothetical protein
MTCGEHFLSGTKFWTDHVTGCAFDNLEPSTKTMTEFMDGLVRTQVRLTGRFFLSSTSHLNLSRFGH